ncbi:leucine-rich repeat and guanylate kinase domain-containing protein-like isoform X2 [Corticium candelabrum]|uniref:leucine-rich repeat and guanylate kinase domain-containing protein-like isoform X2 n=1 Tax=Corticium candelabrum TaxID=121492 RepID=UPI002E2634F3|nr:leucine-rich repeat and guanylate kinase domain-containing protein-like isoform X2 [Corticium candelabrum]
MLSVVGRGLHDISLLTEHYIHLQSLELQYNSLTDLSSLSTLRYLLYLNVSHNELTSLLDFDPPLGLREVDASFNQINEMSDLSAHHSLAKLVLNCNSISEIKGLSSCHRLNHLEITHNQIERISGLDHLPIKHLDLSCNKIKKTENLETLELLTHLDLSGNKLRTLKGLQDHPLMGYINVEDNDVIDLTDMKYLREMTLLRKLNMKRNPLQVTAINMFAAPLELLAATDHMTNVRQRVLNQHFDLLLCTMPAVDTPYPMMVLCGPQGVGKMQMALQLVRDLQAYFGLGVSHTTRKPRVGEADSGNYVFVSEEDFEKMRSNGEFIETCCVAGHSYGLTFNAVESVAQEGLACITCMELEGVMSLKKSYFEPRYLLVVPQSLQVHVARMRERGYYTEAEIERVQSRVEKCIQIHQDRPGCFEQAINSDDIDQAYGDLKHLVVQQYLALSNDPTPFSSAGHYGSATSKGLAGTSQALAQVFSRPSSSATGRTRSVLEEQLYKRRLSQARAAVVGPAPPPRHSVSAPASIALDVDFGKEGIRDTSNVSLSALQNNQPTPSSSESRSRSGSSLSGFSGARDFSCSPISPRSQSPSLQER